MKTENTARWSADGVGLFSRRCRFEPRRCGGCGERKQQEDGERTQNAGDGAGNELEDIASTWRSFSAGGGARREARRLEPARSSKPAGMASASTMRHPQKVSVMITATPSA
jgi:hypothetical protein